MKDEGEGGQRPHDLPERGGVVGLDTAAQGKNEQFLRQRAGKELGPADQRLFQALHAREGAAIGESA